MKRFLTIAFLVITTLPGLCDGTQTLIQWRGWRIQSNENLAIARKHTSYPLTYLVDSDPSTAWVFSGTKKGMKKGAYYEGADPNHQWIQIDGSAVIDSVWVMNGYNRSPELFKRNNRIVQVKLFVNGKPVKIANLSDEMGWHKISMPRQPVYSLKLVFTGVRKGKDNDTCISELALYDGAQKVDMHLPKMVLFSPGQNTAQDWYIVTLSGQKVIYWASDNSWKWSPSKRRIAGIDYSKKNGIWIRAIDLDDGRTLYLKPLRTHAKSDFLMNDEWLKWKGDSEMVVDVTHIEGNIKDGGAVESEYGIPITLE